MFPLRDNIPSRTTPFVNYVLIAATTLVFFGQLSAQQGGTSLIESYGMIPARVQDPGRPVEIVEETQVRAPGGRIVTQRTPRTLAPSAVPPVLTLLTCIFLHGGWLHFLGNMWFLFIFGDNVEDRFGHGGYVLFYTGCGIAASLAHLLTNVGSPIPTIGASGAIAGVMGAYFVLYPRARVLTLIPVFFFLYTFVVPAPVFLAIWFIIQFVQGAAALGNAGATGVAWWAHIGGFLAGVLAVVVLGRRRKLRPAVVEVREGSDRVGMHRVGRPRDRA